MKIQDTPVEILKPNPYNARSHSKKQIAQIAKSIQHFGFVVPIVTDENGVILSGHGRYKAAKRLGLAFVPVVKVYGLSAAKKRALALADNRIAENAGWDRERLAIELSQLSELLIGEGLDISITGFATPEIPQITASVDEDASDPADTIDAQWLSEKPVSQRGDLWSLENHCVLCGDARESDALARLIGERRAAMAFLDPFYNFRVRDIVVKHQEFAMASGELSCGKLVDFLTSTLCSAASVSLDGAVHFICIDWRHIGELLEVSRGVYGEMLNLAVWTKSNASQGSFYRSGHELIAVFGVGDTQHLNNLELGRHGRNRSNVWRYQNAKTFRTGRMNDLKSHLIVKPVALVADAMNDCTRRGDIVIDTFSGLGTTILAAERVDRHARAIEIEPRRVDVTIRRWQAFTHKVAIHIPSGRCFDELAIYRADNAAAALETCADKSAQLVGDGLPFKEAENVRVAGSTCLEGNQRQPK